MSIVIPIYNPPVNSFSCCMESVLTQSYKDIEVILVDDGSESSFTEKIDKWEKCDSRVHVIHQENGGVGSARNHGIALAKGKYICFVDADDLLIENWISKAVEEAERNKADIVYGVVKMVSDVPSELPNDENQKQILVVEKNDLWRVQKLMLSQQKTPLQNMPYLDLGPYGKLFRTEVVKKNLYPEGLPLAEDQVFNHAILRQVDKVLMMDTLAYYYICNTDSATHQYRPDAVRDLLHAMENIRTLLFETPEVQHAFYLRLICEVILGIQLAYFHPKDHSLTMRQRREHVKKTLHLPQVQEAWENIDLRCVSDKKVKTKIWLMKKKCFFLLELFWLIKFYYRKSRRVY